MALPQKVFDTEPSSTLAKDFKIFGDPGFLVALFPGLLPMGAVGGLILYANVKYGISPL